MEGAAPGAFVKGLTDVKVVWANPGAARKPLMARMRRDVLIRLTPWIAGGRCRGRRSGTGTAALYGRAGGPVSSRGTGDGKRLPSPRAFGKGPGEIPRP